MLGHRGLTHSFLFAIVLSAVVVALFFRKPIEGVTRKSLFAYFFVATISHAMLDGMVNGTLGVALLAPFNAERFFLPLRPIVSSPVGWDFFSVSGLEVLKNEFVWLWAPSLLIIFAPWLRRRFSNVSKTDQNAAPNLGCGASETPAMQPESLP
jgi:inner membrane protein